MKRERIRCRIAIAWIKYYIKYLAIAYHTTIRSGELQALAAIRLAFDTNFDPIRSITIGRRVGDEQG